MLGHMNGYGWGGMGVGMVLWWVLLAAALALLIRYVTQRGKEKDELKDARGMLDERYARGEIGREEYEQTKHDLEN